MYLKEYKIKTHNLVLVVYLYDFLYIYISFSS